MSKKSTVNVGIIGIGMIGMEHIRGFRVIPRCKVAAIADTNEERLAKAASEYEIPNAFSQYKDLIALEDLDAVVICTPSNSHEEIALAGLAAGKHVLCEKPMAVSSASALKMVKRAKKAGRILASCSGRYRFSPSVQKAKELIEAGELGDIYHITLSGISRRNRPGIDFHPAAAWCLDKSIAGGGAMLDWGVYDLNILYSLMDNLAVERVDGFCYHGLETPRPADVAFDVEEHGAAMIRCKGGLTVFWERSWAAHMNSSTRIRIYGSKAGIAFDPLAWTQDIFFQIYEDRSGKPVTIAPATTFEKWSVILSVSQDFIQAIVKDRQPASTGEDEIKVLKIIEALYRSANKSTAVSV
ncbi:MAG: Gfo/Idh/MocA family oxidoreductase [Candidatus Omnitrophica bacterium]|nr:Gfo/Idh/MocA family oxidoreductase [Candidatus Omnitrophota bacterium]